MSAPAAARPPRRVLLVDDVPGEATNFRQAFGDGLTAVRNLPELDARLAAGEHWDIAFVDFALSRTDHTGLSAMLRLHREHPRTAIVTYSQFGESGRVLYAAAARQWLGAAAVLDKSRNHHRTLLTYADTLSSGMDPSPPQWRARLQRSALIDLLLPDLSWVDRWRALDRAAGDVSGAADLLQLKSSHLRGFKERAVAAVTQINTAFFGIPDPGPTRNKKGILGTFVALHHAFLTAPDLARMITFRDEQRSRPSGRRTAGTTVMPRRSPSSPVRRPEPGTEWVDAGRTHPPSS